ncbi:MAG: hypothetical protein H8E73_03895 [Planctomycetes bacterium]|nr:hypothetical protein [Planctomycetota bacterium]
MDKPNPVKEKKSKPRADHRRGTPGSRSRSRRDFLKSSLNDVGAEREKTPLLMQ